VNGIADISTWSTDAYGTAKAAIALIGAALLVLDAALRRAGVEDRSRRLRDILLLATAAAAAFAWVRFAPIATLSYGHPWDLYHHALGAKYFHELGYTRLYDCTLIADLEAGFPVPPDRRPLRNLVTNRVEKSSAAAADPDGCKRHFTPERWLAFGRDLDSFRRALPERSWGSILTDHGFNASPVWTITGSAFVPQAPLSWPRLRALARIDFALLAVMWAAAFWGFGLRAACTALIFFGTHYLGSFSWIGGSFLRYDWLAASVIGAALVQRGRPLAGGFALTWATLLRIFPGFLVAAVVLHAAIDLARRRSLSLSAEHRRFAIGCVLALATLVPLSIAVAGRDAWPEFVANSRKHLATPLLNFVGWKTVVSFDAATSSGVLRDSALDDPFTPWHEAMRANFEKRQSLYWAGIAAFVALLAAALACTPLGAAPLLGIGLVVVCAQIGSYYYALLVGYGLLAARFDLLGPALLLGAAASLAVADVVTGSSDVVFVALSALWTAFAVAATALAVRGTRSAAQSDEAGRQRRRSAEIAERSGPECRRDTE